MALNFPNITTTDGEVTFSDAADWLTACAQEIADESNVFLTAMEALQTVNFGQVGDLPNFNSVVWVGGTAGILNNQPVKPVLSVANIQTLLQQLATLTPPSAPVTQFNYNEPGYTSQLRQPMIEKLLNDVVNGGYGIDVNDEIALFNRARDREALLGMANVEELKRQAAATSFPLPQGALYAALQRARQDEMSRNSSVNRDIALKRADLFVENRRRVIEQILASEAQEMALYNAIQARAILAAQTEIQLAISLFDAGVRLFAAQLQSLTSQITANLDTARTQVQLYAGEVGAYSALVNAIVSAAEIDVANSRNILTRDIAQHQAKVDIVKFRLQQLITTVENSRNINQFGTEFFRTGLGAAMNGINGLATSTAG